MRFKYQIFLTLITVSTLVIGLMFMINSWNFARGFLTYVNSVEKQRLEPLINALADGYQHSGDWQWLTTEKQAFRRLVEKHWIRDRRPISRPDTRRTERPRRPAVGNLDRSARPPKPPGRSPPPGGSAITIDPRLLLADDNKTILIGPQRNSEHVQWQPISVGSDTVGYLGFRPLKQVTDQLDQVFEKQQKQGFGYAALAMLIICALMAIPLAAFVVKPLRKLDKAVDQISQGQYDHRVSLNRRDEFGDLARNINHLGKTLEHNLDARHRWIAEISHELRTPVAVLRGELEAMQDGIRPIDPDAVSSLHSEVIRLNRLIDDLHDLSLSDIGALNYQMQTVDLQHITKHKLDASATLIRSADLFLNFTAGSGSVLIRGDQHRIDQMLGNLLQNSIRYTHKGGIIDVSVSHSSQMAVIVWQDSSPGVTDQQLPKLFDPLYRTDSSRNSTSGGSGLGLSIVEKIVHAHSGTIIASHAETGGLCMTISIPLYSGAST